VRVPILTGAVLLLVGLHAGAPPILAEAATPTAPASPSPEPPSAPAVPADLVPSPLPLSGWATKEAPRRYTPENLYEYIDGAAEAFIDADFRDLISQEYEAPGGRSLTVDLYRHADAACAFGIYSQERPRQGPFLSLGVQGYYERGILNFVKGDTYVKLAAFGLGDTDRQQLLDAATAVAARIKGETRMPKLFQAFPAEGKVVGSERYLRRNVLGYPFLERAFVTDYWIGGKKLSLFILAPGDEAGAKAVMTAFVKSQGTPEVPAPGTPLTLQDMHHGTLTILRSGTHVVVLLGDAGPESRLLLQKVQKSLEAF
jgi:hypothetical protein